MFGVGALTLPSAFARLGWLPGLLVLGLVFLQTTYAAHLFDAMAAWHPDAKVWADGAGGEKGALMRFLLMAASASEKVNVSPRPLQHACVHTGRVSFPHTPC